VVELEGIEPTAS